MPADRVPRQASKRARRVSRFSPPDLLGDFGLSPIMGPRSTCTTSPQGNQPSERWRDAKARRARWAVSLADSRDAQRSRCLAYIVDLSTIRRYVSVLRVSAEGGEARWWHSTDSGSVSRMSWRSFRARNPMCTFGRFESGVSTRGGMTPAEFRKVYETWDDYRNRRVGRSHIVHDLGVQNATWIIPILREYEGLMK